ncbi:3-hydroxyisobutyrate dehydrogenase [Thalassobaculum fulvum]|uniref:3-hydroxyisobutyrate dehydrogenase n=1 Tax=Thalassobaculum fulvum TaxID=1633335 RepID=A0A919CNQ9_9PROT|nr:NAD(P)-dependent oxidoreductase [Thalassobaculum fulvum]GHD43403.1 3-hydroxyisobutyrate dehydrogenase [Thalassobaculum fulvum]
MTIGFIGLGGMGGGLVRNLATKGRAVRCFDLDPAKVERAAGFGALPAASAREAADGAPILALCVTTAEAVDAILFGPDGVAGLLPAGAVVLDHTTVNPGHVERMNRLCAERGLRYAEAPMTRTPIHAEQGCVNVLFGGEAALLDELRPVFECYAENVFHVGPSGHAIRLKLIHNFIAFANVAAFCEGFALAAREGLDMTKVIGIISAAGGKSGMMDLYGEKTLRRDFAPYMSLANAQKDVKYYARWLEEAGLPGFMAESVHQTYALASALGHGEEGCTAVIKAYEHLSGVEARLPDPDGS